VVEGLQILAGLEAGSLAGLVLVEDILGLEVDLAVGLLAVDLVASYIGHKNLRIHVQISCHHQIGQFD